ncbi:MAG: hypothetical protein ACKOPP_06155, partial [Bacteroidota bacterium]
MSPKNPFLALSLRALLLVPGLAWLLAEGGRADQKPSVAPPFGVEFQSLTHSLPKTSGDSLAEPDSLKAARPPATGGAVQLTNPIEEKAEFDPQTGLYILRRRMGSLNLGPDRSMTLQEYLRWKENKDKQSYWRSRN